MAAEKLRHKRALPRREALRPVAGLVFLGLMLSGAAVMLRQIDAGKPKDWNQSQLLYLPSGKLLKPLALDYNAAVADMIWVRGMLYFSDQYLRGLGYVWMGHILDVVTELNPHLLPAYEFGGTVLVKDKGQWRQTRQLLQRGIAVFPDNWRLRVYLAMGELSVDTNYVAAAEALKPAALLPGIPNYVRTLSATLFQKGGRERMALAFLVDQYLHSPEAINRDVFLNRILKIFPAIENAKPDKEEVRKILALAQADSRSEPIVLNVLSDYLRGDLSPGSRRVLERLNEETAP